MREETPSAVDWAAVYGNWIAIDKIVYGLVNHHHTGSAALANPDTAPTLSTAATGGVLPAGITYFGVVSYYDSSGRETGKSAAGTITTTAAIAAPNTPTHNFQATPTDLVADNSATPVGLLGGDYWYKLTYIKGGGETTASQPVYVSVPTDTLYAATIHFDSLTTAANGATKIFIYRKSGSTGSYVKLIEISASATDSYTDNNVAVPTCDKQPPATNTTNAFNTVTFDWSTLNYSDAAYVNLYITTTGTVGTPTFISNTHKVTSVTVNLATPVTNYVWSGTALTTGKPLSTSQCFISPSKVILDNEVTGNLLWANLPDGFTWLDSVSSYANLPTGVIGGAVVVEDEAVVYIWDATLATPTWVTIPATHYRGVFLDPASLPTAIDEDIAFVETDGSATPTTINTWYKYDTSLATPGWVQVMSATTTPYGQISALNQTAAATPLTQVDFTITGASRFLVTKIAIDCTDGQATPVIGYDIELYENSGRTVLAYQAQSITSTTYIDRSPWEYFGSGDIYARLINNTSSAITDFDITIDYRS